MDVMVNLGESNNQSILHSDYKIIVNHCKVFLCNAAVKEPVKISPFLMVHLFMLYAIATDE